MTIRNNAARSIALTAMLALSINLAGCKPKAQEGNQAAAPTQQELDAINRLHQQDMEASKKWDVDALVALWTDDIVSIPAFGSPVIGKEANRAALAKMKEEARDVEIVEYKLDFKEVKVAGDWAFEWGTFSGATRPAGGGDITRSSGNVMRVLKREADGSWKVARTMFNTDSLGDEEPPR